MKRFVEGEDRRQGVLLPEFLDDYVSEENPVRVIDAFVEALDLGALGFEGVVPEATGRPGYHPGLLLRIYVYGYINQVASSRRLEREAQRNVERRAGQDRSAAEARRLVGGALERIWRRRLSRSVPRGDAQPPRRPRQSVGGKRRDAVRAGRGGADRRHRCDWRVRARALPDQPLAALPDRRPDRRPLRH